MAVFESLWQSCSCLPACLSLCHTLPSFCFCSRRTLPCPTTTIALPLPNLSLTYAFFLYFLPTQQAISISQFSLLLFDLNFSLKSKSKLQIWVDAPLNACPMCRCSDYLLLFYSSHLEDIDFLCKDNNTRASTVTLIPIQTSANFQSELSTIGGEEESIRNNFIYRKWQIRKSVCTRRISSIFVQIIPCDEAHSSILQHSNSVCQAVARRETLTAVRANVCLWPDSTTASQTAGMGRMRLAYLGKSSAVLTASIHPTLCPVCCIPIATAQIERPSSVHDQVGHLANLFLRLTI